MDPNEITMLPRRLQNISRSLRLLIAISVINLIVLAAILWRNPAGARLSATLTNTARALSHQPINEQLKIASVVAVTKWSLTDAEPKAILSEILKQKRGINFPYKIGDAVRGTDRPSRHGVDYGEGEILFYTGSPPTLQYSVVYAEGRLRNEEQTPLDALREILRTASE